MSSLLKVLVIVCVLLLAWRRRALPVNALLGSLTYSWLIFFVFSPGVSAQYMVWLMPFVLLLSPLFYACLVVSSSLFLFFFYNTSSDSFPWYMAIALHRKSEWVPWSLLPWGVLIAGMILFWQKAFRADPSLRIFSFERLPARSGS